MLIRLNDPSPRRQHRHRAASRLLSRHHGKAWEVTGGANVGVGLRLTVRLDTDPRTDPLPRPTAQVRSAFTASHQLQTDPLWGLPPGDAYA